MILMAVTISADRIVVPEPVSMRMLGISNGISLVRKSNGSEREVILQRYVHGFSGYLTIAVHVYRVLPDLYGQNRTHG